jgi:hypothetical protein
MLSNSSSADGLRCSPWNTVASAPRFSGYPRGLALETPACSRRSRTSPGISARTLGWSGNALRSYAAPWMTTPIRRYHSGNWLTRILNRIIAELWPLTAIEDFSNWLLEGAESARLFLGILAGAVAALIIFQNAVPLVWVQTLVNSSFFFGHGALLIVLASVLAGLTVLPVVLAQLIPLLMRLVILAGLCALTAGICYAGWQLILSARFF